MNKILRVFLIIAAIAGIVFSVCIFSLFYIVPFLTDTIKSNWDAYPQLNFAFGVYMAVIGFLFISLLVLAVAMPAASSFLTIKKDRGELRYSKKTVESIARLSISDMTEIENSEIRSKFGSKSDKTKIFITMTPADKSTLSTVTESIQSRVEEALRSSLGIEVKCVTIKVVEPKTSGNDAIVYSKNVEKEAEKDDSVV